MGSLVKYFPKNKAKANKILIIVGFKYIKIGSLKQIVSPPKNVIKIPLTSGIVGIFFSKNQTTASAIKVATISGGIATDKFLSLLQ